MAARKRSIHARLMMAFSAFSASMLLAAFAIGVGWFFFFEREEMRSELEVNSAIIATQSTAALMFRDVTAMEENLSVFKHVSIVRWATLSSEGRIFATYGTPPSNLDGNGEYRSLQDGTTERFDQIILRKPLIQNGVRRGELTVKADLTNLNVQFVAVLLIGALLIFVFMAIALPVFHRIVATISEPLGELSRITRLISAHGDQGARVTVRYKDEVGRLSDSFNEMLDSLAQRDQSLRSSRDQLRALNERLHSVREDERTRIAHEIHDELGQRLTAIKLEISRKIATGASPNDPELGAIARMVDETVKTVREISWELRPSVLDTLGLKAAIEWLGEDFQRRMGTRCLVTLPDHEPDVSPEVSTHLFRICQELLTNVSRHSRASRVGIQLTAKDFLELQVSDDGIGFQATGNEEKSLGLLGVRERTHQLGGIATIETTPQFQGTRITIRAPYHRSTQVEPSSLPKETL